MNNANSLTMKKLLFLLFFSNLGVAKSTLDAIEIRLVNGEIGKPENNGTFYSPVQSNDAGLNAILQNYNISYYGQHINHIYPPYHDRYIEIWCQNCLADQLNQLRIDLGAYSSVIERVRSYEPHGAFNDCLYSQIATASLGVPVGINNGIIVTNDDGLNQIFQNYNVFYYAQYAPYSTNESLLRTYGIACNCNSDLLKTALDNYTSVISYTEIVTGSYLLKNPSFDESGTIVYPNPFSDHFSIDTKKTVMQYSISDISGKVLVTSNLKQEIDIQSEKLSTGTYLLELQFDHNQKSIYKLVKK